MADSKPGQDFPPMVPDRDDIRKRRPSEPPPAKKSPPKPSPAAPDGAASEGAGPVAWTLLILLLCAVVALAILVVSQRQTLADYEERLQLADERLVTLERSVTQTDESVAMNETAINARFNTLSDEDEFQMSEIRKLWAVANERNREWIEANQAAVAELESSVTGLGERLDTQGETLASVDERLAEVTALETELADLESDLAALESQLDGFDPQAIDERLVSLTLAQENQMMDIGELADQLGSLERSLDSIDSGRLETNRRLVALSEQLQTLEDRVSALNAGPGVQ